MATIENIKELALAAAKRQPLANYTIDTVDNALRGELFKMADSINNFNRYKYDIFDILIETIDEVVPKRVIDRVSIFADVKVVPQGQKALFKRKVGRNRAKQFLTQVGLSGVYETFRLDTETFEVSAHAVGGAGTIDFERMLDGAENMADIMDIITEGLEDAAYYEIMRALQAAYNNARRPAANQVYENRFDSEKMAGLVNICKAYGDSAVIFACPEFVNDMGPDAIVPGTVNYQGIYSPRDIEDIANTGRIKMFRGTPIVEIPQSFIDENNEKTVFNPQYAYVLPTGRQKVVDLVFEGQTQMYDWINKDQSIEINAYKKMGTAILTQHDWCIYVNTKLEDNSDSFYGF